MIEVINASTGRNTATEDKFPRQILSGAFAAGFTTGLLTKDLNFCVAAAAALGVPMPVAAAVTTEWRRAAAELGADTDITRIASLVAEAAGVSVSSRRDRTPEGERRLRLERREAARLGRPDRENQKKTVLVDRPALGALERLEEAALLIHQGGRARHLGRAERTERQALAVDRRGAEIAIAAAPARDPAVRLEGDG